MLMFIRDQFGFFVRMVRRLSTIGAKMFRNKITDCFTEHKSVVSKFKLG